MEMTVLLFLLTITKPTKTFILIVTSSLAAWRVSYELYNYRTLWNLRHLLERISK